MRNSNLNISLFIIFTCLTSGFSDDEDDLGKSMEELGKAAVGGYMSPFPTWIGTGMNSGWYNTSKSMKMFGLPVGFTILKFNIPIVMMSKDQQTFDFNGTIPLRPILEGYVGDQQSGVTLGDIETITGSTMEDELKINIKDAPTVIGSETAPTRTIRELLTDGEATNTLSIIENYNTIQPGQAINLDQSVDLPFRGVAQYDGPTPAFPGVGVEGSLSSLPVLDNITMGLRYFPTLDLEGFGSVGQLGVKFQHDFTRLIPIKLPFINFSAQYAFNKFFLDLNDFGKISMNNNLVMVNASLDLKFFLGLGIYSGVGYERSNLLIEYKGNTGLNVPAFDVEIVGENGFRTQLGLRLSLILFDVYADVNAGQVQSFNVGIAVGLNGL